MGIVTSQSKCFKVDEYKISVGPFRLKSSANAKANAAN